MERAERLDWLRLWRSQNVGPSSFRILMERYGSAGDALKALPGLARRGGRREPIRIAPREQAESELARIAELGATLVAICEPAYPEPLAAIDDPPPLLCLKGHPHLLRRPAVALVGARNASANGMRLARRMAEELAAAGLTVVSGLARGLDAAAHAGALKDGTAAVVAGGIDVTYPRENAGLYEAIGEAGVLASEQAPGTTPQARHFPRRNRIISGLSLAVVVVEAAPRSGSLITARLALEQGREVLAVPGSPLDPRARGGNGLIRDGATLVESASDVLAALAPLLRRPLAERRRPNFAQAKALSPADGELAEARRRLLGLLSAEPAQVDEVIRQCQLSSSIVTIVLLELELAGRIERFPGNRVARVYDPLAPENHSAAGS